MSINCVIVTSNQFYFASCLTYWVLFGSLIPAHVCKCISYNKAIGRLIITWRVHCPYKYIYIYIYIYIYVYIYIYMHVSINVCMYLWIHGYSMEVTKCTSCHKVSVPRIGRTCCIKTIHIYYDHPNLLGFKQSVCFLSQHSSSKYIWKSHKRFTEELKSIKIITSIEDYLTCLGD